MTTTTELHAAIAQMQVLMNQAADVIEHNTKSLAEAHKRNGIIEDREVQAAVESDIALVAHLRAAALPWDQRHKQPVVDCHATGVCVQSGLRAEQPAQQQEPVAFEAREIGEGDWFRVSLKDVNRIAGIIESAHMDYKWIYTTPPASKPLTNLGVLKLAYNHHWLTSLTLRDAYFYGFRDAEAAHGITGEQK